VVVACSSEEYGPPERLPVTEDAPLRPRNPYAASKAVSDLLAGFYADGHGMWVTRTRDFSHAGPGQREEYVMSGLARQIAVAERAGQEEVTVVCGNTAVRRDFVDVRDVARALLAAAEAEPGVFNVCSGRSTSIADILAGLAELTALSVHQRTDPGLLRPNEVMEIVGSHERLSRATGWAPEVPLDQTLADTLDWWRKELA
jgi:GDP-4-dehydro-6-deoxy-D-mannose reductase